MGLNRNINDDSTLAYLFNKTRQGASDALQKAIDAINATIASIQTALNNKASKNGSDITNAATWRSNIGAVNKAGDTMTDTLWFKSTNLTNNTAPASSTSGKGIYFKESSEKTIGHVVPYFSANGNQGFLIQADRAINGTNNINYLFISVDSSGNPVISLQSPTPWRSALGLGTSGALPITIAQGGTGQTQVLTVTTVSNIATAATGFQITGGSYSYWGKMAQIKLNLKCTTASSASSVMVATIASGKRPASNLALIDSTGGRFYVNTSGNMTFYRSFAVNATFEVGFTYLLPN